MSKSSKNFNRQMFLSETIKKLTMSPELPLESHVEIPDVSAPITTIETQPNSLSKKQLRKAQDKIEREKLWNEVGFHRITGGFFYNYVLLIVGAITGLVLIGVLLVEFMPYPEIEGYKKVAAAFLGFWFGLLDFNLGGGGGLSDGITRFIGQYSDTNPRRALKYIQFYVWFQMFSGLIQVTGLIIVCLVIISKTASTAYLVYFIIAEGLVQYPGMLMIMQSSLKSFQRGDKTAILQFLQENVFQFSINIIFLIIGKQWGASNPAIGELMGITIFYIAAQYMDDWFNLIVGGVFLHKVLKERGLEEGVWAIFRPDFDKDIVKECLTYTGKQWITGQALSAVNYVINLYFAITVTGYAAFTGLLLIPNFLGHLVSTAGPMASSAIPAISESYNNKKMELTRYFIHNLFKYFGFLTCFLYTSLAVLSPRVIEIIVKNFPGLANYRAGVVMIPIVMMVSAAGVYTGLWGRIFAACNDPTTSNYIGMLTTPTGYAIKWLFYYLCIVQGVLPIWYILLLPDFVNGLIAMVIGYATLQKKIIKLDYKKMAWQAFIAPLLASVMYIGILYIFMYTLWPAMEAFLGLMMPEMYAEVGFGVIVLLLMLFVFPGIFFCPCLAWLGGWDDYNLDEFRKTAILSGPSKGIVMIMYKISNKFAKISPWHNKFPLADYTLVKQEIADLVAEGKMQHWKKKN